MSDDIGVITTFPGGPTLVGPVHTADHDLRDFDDDSSSSDDDSSSD